MSSGKRYKFNGSTIAVQTGYGSGKQVNSISLADPAVVTAPAHGFVLADIARLNHITEPSQLDGVLVVVDNPTTNTFEAAGVDSTDWSAFSDGSPTTANATKATMSEFCELTGINQQDGGADQHEVSTVCSTAKEFEQGLSDPGTLQLDFNWAGNETVQAALRTAKTSGDKIAVKITFPGSGGFAIMIGTVQQTSFAGSVSSVVYTATATLKLSGPVYVLESA